jgi:glutamyl-tRNA reductase
MNVIMSGVDHRLADAAGRECYALTPARQAAVLEAAKSRPEVLGAAVISTCSRTEIYLSLQEGAFFDPFALLGAAERPHETKAGRGCFDHLAALASGALSSIFAEDQILAQVKAALAFAREHRAPDSALEVFFRQAITAAKRVKTELRFSHGDCNVAAAAREILRERGDCERVLVIGNGEIGRLCADTLARAGCRVAMTLRQYRHADAAIPEGVAILPYEERYAHLGEFDAVVSATASPHCTITARELAGMARLPRVFLDLAMPRDIDPAVGLLPGVALYDIDAVSSREAREGARAAAMEQMKPYLDDGWRELTRWETGRDRLTQEPERTHFPLFVACTGKKALVVGGGKIAARRVRTLARFTFEITVVAPEIREEILEMEAAGRLECRRRPFEEGDLEDAFLVLAATDSRAVNHRVASLARHRGVFASIADERDECSFFFPAVAESGRVTVGVCGDGSAHAEVAAAAKKIREALHGE